MKEKTTQLWIPIYVDKWIFGSTRIELEPAERSVFVDLMVLGAKDDGFVRANETMAYLPRQLAGLLNITEDVLKSTIQKCKHYAKLDEPTPGIYRLTNWDNYQLSEDYKYRIETGRKRIPGGPVRENSDRSPKNGENFGPIRKDRIGEEKREEKKRTAVAFQPPTLEQVRDYCRERGNSVNPEKWLSHYQSNGWRVGRNPMKDWKAAVRTWEGSNFAQEGPASAPKPTYRYLDPKESK